MEKPKFYLTTAIAYASRKPHIGNTYEIILADAIARYKRQRGYDVHFLTGTDEHGQKIEDLAKEEGISPKEYVDKVAGQIKEIWDGMNTTYSRFIRTTDEDHERVVSHIFKKLYDQGDIYKNEYEGWYCIPCESFITESQLKEGKCPDCGRDVTRTKEETYYFKMTKYADRLIKHIEENPGFIEPESRKKEMLNNFLLPGLQDLCVSRTSFKWGVPVPFDEKHVIYVWIDALSNYITALGYDVNEKGELYSKYWPADVHIIGKDILRFHTIYWPIMLMALGEPLPKKVFGHPWLLSGMDKMSKSRGNVLYADDLAAKFGVDGVRYYVLAEMPYGSDGTISYENIIKRYNTDLANNLGNLFSRTLSMTEKYFGGVIPAPTCEGEFDADLKATCKSCLEKYEQAMDTYHVADALEELFTMLRRANKYIDETTPWTLAKDEALGARLGTVLYNLLETLRLAAVALSPFMPASCEKILSSLGSDIPTDYESLQTFGGVKAGEALAKAEILFARIDEKKFLEEIEKEEAEKAAKNAPEPQVEKPEEMPLIEFDDFMKVEIRCAKILAAEPVKKAKKLLKLQVDLGYEQRQVVSGIAKYYKPEELVGKKVALVCNLKPAVLCGVESNGMILASGEEDVKVLFLDETTALGARIR